MAHPHGIHGAPRSDLVLAMDLGTDKVHQYVPQSSIINTVFVSILSSVEKKV
jgi:6-phosphogluconolactonase (cycloisomerase 2 family)